MGQIPNKFGVLLGMGCERFGTGSGQEQVWNRFQTSSGFFLGQVWDRFGTDLGHVQDRFGIRTGLGQIPNNFGILHKTCQTGSKTGTGQIWDKNRFGTDSKQFRNFAWDRL